MSGFSHLPSELIAEIGTHLDYEEVQKLRLVCHRIDEAVQHLALSRLKIHFPQTRGYKYRSRIPFDKIEAYTTPGQTPGINFVRHLTVDRLCIDLNGSKPPMGRIKINEPIPTQACHSSRVHQRFYALKALFQGLLLGERMKNLETVTWNVRRCHIHCPELDYPHEEHECQEILEMFARILAARGPLHQLKIVIDEDSILQRHSGGIPCIPPCRELVLEGVSDLPGDGGPDYLWVHKIINECPGLETVDTDWRFDGARLALHFPPPSATTENAAAKIKYTAFFLYPGDYQISQHIIDRFRFLKQVDISCSFIADIDDDFHQSVSSLWSLLKTEQIYVEEISLHLGSAETSLVSYLASFPRPTLKRLDLWSYDDEDADCLPGVADDFFSRAFPVIAAGLETFSVDTFFLNEWCYKPETFLKLHKCVSLKEVSLSMDKQYTGEGFKDMVYNTFNRHHHHLQAVEINEILDDNEPLSRWRYKKYTLEFAGPCLKVMWGGVCNLHRSGTTEH